MTAFHHFEQWWFYPHWRSDCDVSDPKYAGLYGPMHNLDGLPGGPYQSQFVEWRQQDRPPESFHQFWRTKIDEVIDAYQPDLMWFDFGLRFIQEDYRKRLLAYSTNTE
jgi:alpha-L-fucosidase